MLKQERRKQKEFFEKKKLKSKMKLLEVSASPSKNSAISLDLLNLYVVNQIATKKNKPDISRKAVHVDMKMGIQIPFQRRNVDLSMSPPITSSKTCLDSYNICRQQQQKEKESRKKHLSDRMKYQPLSPVLESKCTGSKRDFQYNSTEDYYPSSSSVSWSPICKRPTEQNATTHICSPWEKSYEENQDNQFLPFFQPESAMFGDPWFCTVENLERGDTNTDIVQFGKMCEQSNGSLGNVNFIDKTRVMNIGKESGSGHGREDLSFNLRNERVQPVLDLFEETNQQINTPLEDCEAFIDKDFGSQLFITDEYRSQNSRCKMQPDLRNMDNTNHKNTVDRCLKSIFTLPEPTFFTTESEQFEEISSKEYDKHRQRLYTVSFEKERNIVGFERSDAESLLSSQSPSYSPRETESCFSASSEMKSEDEDPDNFQIKDTKLETKGYHGNCIQSDGTGQHNSLISTGSQSAFQRTIIPHESCLHLLKQQQFETQEEKNKMKTALVAQHGSPGTTVNMNANYSEKNEKCDAWSQTDSHIISVIKCDAAIQCDNTMSCKCACYCSLVSGTEKPIEQPYKISKVGTTGGQQTPPDNAFRAVTLGKNAHQPNTDYLTLHDKMTLEVLNYINSTH